MKWYRLAAEQGDEVGQWNLGNMYAKGEGVPKNYVIGYMWLNIAGAQEPLIRVDRDALKKELTQEQIAEGPAPHG